MARTKKSMENAVWRYLNAAVHGNVHKTTFARLEADVRRIRAVLGNEALDYLWNEFEAVVHADTRQRLTSARINTMPVEETVDAA